MKTLRRFLWAWLAVVTAVALFGLALVSALAIFGSFFFEETRSQMTWLVAAQHLAIFAGGVTGFAAAWCFLPLVVRCATRAGFDW